MADGTIASCNQLLQTLHVQKPATEVDKEALKTCMDQKLNQHERVAQSASDIMQGGSAAGSAMHELAKNPEDMKVYADKIVGGQGGISQPLSDKQQVDTFAKIAANADGKDTAMLGGQFATMKTPESDAALKRLGEAVAANTSADAPGKKVTFVGEMAPHVTKNPAAAEATAKTLASLKDNPAQYTEAVKALSGEGQLSAVVRAGVHEQPGMLYGSNYSPADAKAIIEGATKSTDPDVKMRVFNAAAEPGAKTGDAEVKNALAELVKSDTTGAIGKSMVGANEATKAAYTDAAIEALKKGGNANTILDGMAPDQMKKVTDALAGLSPQEQKAVFEHIASTASGDQLAALSKANSTLLDPGFGSDQLNSGSSRKKVEVKRVRYSPNALAWNEYLYFQRSENVTRFRA